MLLLPADPPLPCLASFSAAPPAAPCAAAPPVACLRSVPRSAARTAAALDFGQINFQVWERSGSHGSSSYSPPPPPPPVPRRRGCRRGCPQPRSPIRFPPPPSLPLRTHFPNSGFSPRPPFFCKSEGGGVGRDFPPPHPPLSTLIAFQVAEEPGRASPARPADSRPSRPVHPPGRRAAPGPRSGSVSPAAAASCRFPWPSLPASP